MAKQWKAYSEKNRERILQYHRDHQKNLDEQGKKRLYTNISRYSKTEKGRRTHAAAQARYRARKKAKERATP